MADEYDDRLRWILAQARLTPQDLLDQYAAYHDTRRAFEAGYSTVDNLTSLVTPPVAAMLDLEDMMAAEPPLVERPPIRAGFAVQIFFVVLLAVLGGGVAVIVSALISMAGLVS